MRKLLLNIIFLMSFVVLHADEGMWMLTQIDEILLEKMQAKGCQLGANEIYNANDTV